MSFSFMYPTMKAKKVRHIFSEKENEKLKQLVEEYGDHNWSLIASFMKNRNARQCRERWRTYLRPTLSIEPWSPEEDRILLEKYAQFGTRWSVIGQYLPSRSEIAIKNRWKLLNQVYSSSTQFQAKPTIGSMSPQPFTIVHDSIPTVRKPLHPLPPITDLSQFSDGNDFTQKDSSSESSTPEITSQDLESFFNSLSTAHLKNCPKVTLMSPCL